ncbi:hypothetical protein TNCV_4993061 [Trichonephila clavipes]|nr:hypothetical protein TNCV_4993061 [Trichonephila clavipes]
MDEQLKALLECINALKSGQEDMQKNREKTKERMENMQKSQVETKERMENMQKSQEETKKRMETGGDLASRVGGLGNQDISEITAPETIKKVAAPSVCGVVEQGT